MLAIMTDQQQHTLLTRFVSVMPGDAELDAKIHSVLADVDLVLPAVALLADERCAAIDLERATNAGCRGAGNELDGDPPYKSARSP
jgi:hypothetical protein